MATESIRWGMGCDCKLQPDGRFLLSWRYNTLTWYSFGSLDELTDEAERKFTELVKDARFLNLCKTRKYGDILSNPQEFVDTALRLINADLASACATETIKHVNGVIIGAK